MKFKKSVFTVGLVGFFGGIILGAVLSDFGVFAFSETHKTFPIQMKVDFGPAERPTYDKTIQIEKGTTPKEAVSQAFPVLSGVACCSFRDVIEIGGVRINPAKNWWWICTVNGSKNISPQRKKLKPGDVVEWKYIQDSQ